jgi:hypothetical protein
VPQPCSLCGAVRQSISTGVVSCNPTSGPDLRGLRYFDRAWVRGKGRLSEASLKEAARSMYQLGGGADEAFERDSQFPMQPANHLQG